MKTLYSIIYGILVFMAFSIYWVILYGIMNTIFVDGGQVASMIVLSITILLAVADIIPVRFWYRVGLSRILQKWTMTKIDAIDWFDKL